MNSTERVAKNTAIQYLRLLLNVFIGLYSVRLILDALGADDYGIYSLVSGVMTSMAFISTSLSQTSIRFIGVSLGQEGGANTKYVFSNCFWLHIFLALSLLVILRIIGGVLFDYYLIIPTERILAAQIVFQCILFSLFVNIIITPYIALIISNERFIVIAIVSIIDSLLKLAIAIIIIYTTLDKLILYGVLLSGITVVNLLAYSIYCHKKFRDNIYYGRFSLKEVRNMVRFASWTVLDVFGVSFTREGYSIILNRYFGTSMNTVFSLARQIEGQLYTISASATDAIRPQIMKREGAGERTGMLAMSFTTGKLGFSLMSIVAIPLVVMMPDILNFWLVEVPEGTILFSRLLIIACLFNQLTQGLVYANQAIGDVKWFSIVVSSCRMIALPISWISFYYGAPAYVAIVVFTICETIGSFSRVLMISRQTNVSINYFFQTTFFRIIPATVGTTLLCMFFYQYVHSIVGIVVSTLLSASSYIILAYFISLTPAERTTVRLLIKKWIPNL